ncbi:MAG: RdgB/HAM1 family non-canonical purine NTP pyrophosphatase [Cyclobacteriaceae bacterium]|nr:RdgB/HAM1 family non-canonical purine NTP pyrophosphatase [Cyclobacteriaceae bacterium]
MKLCFATNNRHKLEEVQAAVGGEILITSLEEEGIHEELPETQNTLEGNARQKARYVFEHYKIACFADDTGLEVDALGGEPGVYSARFAGPQRDSQDNSRLLLKKLSGESNRAAQFRTIIWLALQEGDWSFEGQLRGQILTEGRGNGGFGYDPLFMPEKSTQTLAEMTMDEKNMISHRARAVAKLAEFLRKR